MVDLLAPPPVVGSLDALTRVAPGDLSDDGLGEHLAELHRASAVLDAARVRAAGVFDARAVWARDGARHHEGWVAARTGSSFGTAKVDKAVARALREMPACEEAFARGALSREQVRLLVRARSPEMAAAFDACEDVLVAELCRCTLAAGARFLRRWAAEVRQRFGIGEPDGPEPADLPDASRVHLSGSLDGRWRLDGDLSGEHGEIVRSVVDAQVDAMWRDGVFHAEDGLCASERVASALVEVLVRGSRGGDADGTARPLLVGVVRLRTGADDSDDGSSGGERRSDTVDTSDADGPSDDGASGADGGTGDRRSTVDGAGPAAPPSSPQDSDGPTPRDLEVLSTCPSWGSLDRVPRWDLPDLDVPTEGTDVDEAADGRVPPWPADHLPRPDAEAWREGRRAPADLFGLAELEHAGLAHPADVGRWLCEGEIQVLHLDDEYDELRMGRRIRTANRAQRRALRVRDGGCVFPGCHVHASHCVAHHVRWWEWDGPTDIENLVLLCRFHHKVVHDRGFRLTRVDGRVEVRRPDGTGLHPARRTRPDPTLRPTPHARAPDDDEDEAFLARLTRHRIDRLIAETRAARAGPGWPERPSD